MFWLIYQRDDDSLRESGSGVAEEWLETSNNVRWEYGEKDLNHSHSVIDPD